MSELGRRLNLAGSRWDATPWVKVRIGILTILVVAGGLVTLGRAFQLQILDREELGRMAREQYLRTVELEPRRGEIVDRHGATLASSLEVESIFLDPHLLGADDEEREARARQVAKAAGLDAARTGELIARAMQPGNRFAWVQRKASAAVVAKVKALDLPGVSTIAEARRFYPHKELAAQVLGFVGQDGRGLEGLERALDERLHGHGTTAPALRDARGRSLLPDTAVRLEERTGHTVELTLDRGLQRLAEKALTKAVEASRAISGTAIVLDVDTGEVLALAQAPTFNPNVLPAGAARAAIRNRAVTDVFEPGSTMKVFLMAGALEEEAIEPRQRFDCEGGAWRVGRHVIHDSRPHKSLDARGILQVSSNVCAGKVGLQLGGTKLARLYRDFGFGERTGVGLPGEAAGIVGEMKSDISVVTASFGQGPITATPLQVAAAFAAMANGGELLQPWIVRRVIGPDGDVVEHGSRKVLRRVVSEKTAAVVSGWLESVVTADGTAEQAAIEGYRVAGKTGTSQKVDPATRRYGKGRIASFGGFVPADEPRFAIVVVVDEPKTSVYGGQVAAPVFREIAEGALRYEGIAPTEKVVRRDEKRAPRKKTSRPPAESEGGIAELDEAPAGPNRVRVPDLDGFAARAAVRMLAQASLQARLEGSGRVVRQQPPAGSVVERGTRVALTLQPL